MMSPHVYILKCADGSYYTGATSDLTRRLWEHETGVDSKSYTFTRHPVELIWAEETSTKEEALTFERQIKGWSRKKKEVLIWGDWESIHLVVWDERMKRESKRKRR
jgi:predicted GIY-YIG superfamily endonuclease